MGVLNKSFKDNSSTWKYVDDKSKYQYKISEHKINDRTANVNLDTT